jgi:nitrogen regulatory protein P-II 1
MRKIEAILEPHQIEEVKEALSLIGVRGMTACEVKYATGELGTPVRYRSASYANQLTLMIRLEIVVEDDFADAVVRRLLVTASRKRLADGTITVLPLADAVRIRTRERGPDAI